MSRSLARNVITQMVYTRMAGGNADEGSMSLALECISKADVSANEQQLTEDDKQFIKNTLTDITQHEEVLTERISTCLPDQWPLERIAYINKCILQLCTYEMLYCDQIPNNVAISEALLLANQFSDPKSTRFINGVLGAIQRKLTES